MAAKSKVAVVKTTPETVLDDHARLFDLADARQHLDPSATTILKDNISWHFPYPGANTTPWQLEGTIQKLRADGYEDLVCVQNDTVVTDPKKGERLNKYLPVLDQYDVPVRYNCFEDDLKWVRYEPKGKMLVLPKIYPEGITIPEFFHGKNVVHLPTVKCHIYTTTTGAMKNAFGGLLNTRRHYTHSWIHETLVDLLTIQKEIHSGLFAVMDGTTCGNGPGPRTMIPEEKNVLLASGDQVAIDAVAAKMMGFDPMSIKYIRLAHEAGLGVGDPRDIELVGEDVSSWNFGFSVGDNAVSRFGDLVWFGPLKGIQKLLFRTPLLYFFVFGSFFYHDYVWYPLFGKRRIARYEKTSQWMKLFETYPETVAKRRAA
ncbi:MAG TPA: DUF362 domain-containing protein [Thermoanaerobaculia bacterium]|nr:DUF362 domain-containing protein [Thermoanaerobaculia bacterium]